jgi:hypothetical protein
MLRNGLLGPVIALSCVFGSGCEHDRSHSCPPDPLLLNKRPIEARSDTGESSVLLARREVAVPELLATTLPTERVVIHQSDGSN